MGLQFQTGYPVSRDDAAAVEGIAREILARLDGEWDLCFFVAGERQAYGVRLRSSQEVALQLIDVASIHAHGLRAAVRSGLLIALAKVLKDRVRHQLDHVSPAASGLSRPSASFQRG